MSSIYSLNTISYKPLHTLEEVSVNKSRPRNTFEAMIEFDDQMCLAELNYIRGYYGSLLESSDYILHEGVAESLIEFIKKVIENIFSFIKSIFGDSSNSSDSSSSKKNVIDKQKSATETVEEIKKKRSEFQNKKSSDKTHKVVKYSYPDKIAELKDILPNDQLALVKEIQNAANKLDMASKDYRKEVYVDIAKKATQDTKALSKALKENVPQMKNFSMDATSEENVYAFSEEKLKTLIDGPKAAIIAAKFDVNNYADPTIKSFKEAYEKLAKSIENIEAKDDNKEAISAARELTAAMAPAIKNLTDAYRVYNEKIVTWYDFDVKQLNMLMDYVVNDKEPENIEDSENNEEAQQESFYLTHFDDIMLAEDTKLKYTWYDLIKEGMIKEALILGNPDPSIDKIYEMQMLNEAITNKARNAFNTLIAAIKKAYRAFLEKLRANFTTTKHYLDKYEKVILENRIPEGPYKSKDFINGMYRIIDFELPALQYGTIKDKLQSPYNFFVYIRDNFLANSIPNNLPQVVDGDRNETIKQIGEYFKAYFGCAGNDIEYQTETVQRAVKDMYDFCYDTRKIERSINDSINRMEKLRDEALKQVGVPTQQTQQGENPANEPDGVTKGVKEPTAQQFAQQTTESYFSYINNLDYLLELQNVNNQGGGQAQNNSNAPTSMTGQVAGTMRNVQDGTKDTSGNPVYGVEGSPVTQVDADCQVYASVCKKILEAKLTAVEFCRGEIMQLFRMVVNTYVQGTNAENPRAQNTKEIRNRQQRQ